MNSYCTTFFSDFEIELETLLLSNLDYLDRINKVIELINTKIKELYKWLKKYKFDNPEQEIYFFKHLKPKLVSKLIYYKEILNSEISIPTDKKSRKKFLFKEISKLNLYSETNKEFFKYFRSRSTNKDLDYFVRSNQNNIDVEDCFLVNFDIKLCTTHDYKIAMLIANDLLSVFYENKLDNLNKNSENIKINSTSNLNWTGNKIDLIEIIYALHHQKVINGGNIEIKELATNFGKVFNIDLEDNIYRSYVDIKNRKTLKTKFLNNLSDNLNAKIIEEDF